MRSKQDFEALVFERADVLSKNEHRNSSFKNAAIGTAAAVTILTALAITKSGFFSIPAPRNAAYSMNSQETYAVNDEAGETSPANDVYEDETAFDILAEENDNKESLPQQENSHPTMPKSAGSQGFGEKYYSNEITNHDDQLSWLPVEVAFYNNQESAKADISVLIADKENSNAEKIWDKTQAADFAEKLSKSEQIKTSNFVNTENRGSIVVIRKDTENKVVYVKNYYIFESYIQVKEEIRGLNGEAEVSNIPAEYMEKYYFVEMSDELKELINSAFS